MSATRPSRRGYALVAAAAVLWGMLGIFAKGILATGVGPLEISFWRATLAGAAFVAHAALRGRLRLQRGADAVALILFALVGVTLFYASLNLAIAAGGVSLAILLMYSAPAFVVVLAYLWLHEPLTRSKAALVVLATLGVALVARAGGKNLTVDAASLGWGLTSGLAYASYYLFGKWILRRYAPVTVFAVALPVGALALLPFVTFHPKPASDWMLLAMLALLSTYLAYLAYYSGLRLVEASRAVLVATIEPVVATVLAMLAFGERLGGWGWVGAALVLCAALLSAAPVRSPRPPGSVRPSEGREVP